jgi:hypothetical protein
VVEKIQAILVFIGVETHKIIDVPLPKKAQWGQKRQAMKGLKGKEGGCGVQDVQTKRTP